MMSADSYRLVSQWATFLKGQYFMSISQLCLFVYLATHHHCLLSCPAPHTGKNLKGFICDLRLHHKSSQRPENLTVCIRFKPNGCHQNKAPTRQRLLIKKYVLLCFHHEAKSLVPIGLESYFLVKLFSYCLFRKYLIWLLPPLSRASRWLEASRVCSAYQQSSELNIFPIGINCSQAFLNALHNSTTSDKLLALYKRFIADHPLLLCILTKFFNYASLQNVNGLHVNSIWKNSL